MELADDCHQKDDPPLATTRASVTVDFMPEGKGLGGSGEERNDNKSHKKSGKGDRRKVGGMKSVDMGDLSEILSNIALRDDNSQSKTHCLQTSTIKEPFFIIKLQSQKSTMPAAVG